MTYFDTVLDFRKRAEKTRKYLTLYQAPPKFKPEALPTEPMYSAKSAYHTIR
jgi:hypothetical protein